ncbi:hypothetical protein PybrP1_005615 [[Pythium] brassicae (nom. inval.)]|nr:hypothetical protein PybrP1_005615 [[Pythium] brassicae (nom. inval.)]
MPRTSAVSEKVWAQAIHAVTVQKMSLRRAAQLYGVHHMSLHRRVRGRYVSPATARFAGDFCLSRAEEDEVVSVLREQFEHERRVSSDDVRYVVRTIAGQSARLDLPADFPRKQWITNFKRTHGFVDGGSSPSNSFASSENSNRGGGTAPQQAREQLGGSLPQPPWQQRVVYHATGAGESQGSNLQGDAAAQLLSFAAATPSAAYLQETAASASEDGSSPASANSYLRNESSESESESREVGLGDEQAPEKEPWYPQKSTVSDETWEKAMNAVEIEGMSLRSAAKAHGVHFAALHRRVKKRALIKQSAPPLENYISFEDEAGVVRVIRARADLGVLMTYDELVDLLNRTALKHAPSISAEFSRSLARKFQSRVEQSTRHLVHDWPLPPLDMICHLHAQPLGAAAGGDEAMSSPVPAVLQYPRRVALPVLVHAYDDYASRQPRHTSFSDPAVRSDSGAPTHAGDDVGHNER